MYNVILGRPTLIKIRAIISAICLTMKFFTKNGEIATVKADQAISHQCYNMSLEIQKRKKETGNTSRSSRLSKVMMVDLDAQG